MASSFGLLFRVATWGESHGGGVGCLIDGCPALIPISLEEIQQELNRRKPGQSSLVTQRKESDICRILSGVFDGKTLGTPILISVDNEDARPSAYNDMKQIFRPSHADYTYMAKYGIRNWQGGGRSSARETIGRVAASVLAQKVLNQHLPNLQIVAWVDSIHHISSTVDMETVTREKVDSTPVRCPDHAASKVMISCIENARSHGDSVGGIVSCIIRGICPGLGEPIFDKLEADLAKAMLSLPASKGFELGSGFSGTKMMGSEHNDPFCMQNEKIRTKTNFSGGIQGGISNGENIFFRVAFKPTSTISKSQNTVTMNREEIEINAKGRHDPCVLPRAIPIVEAMATLVICDHFLRQYAQNGLFYKS